VALRDPTGRTHPVIVDVARRFVFNGELQSAADSPRLVARGVRRFRSSWCARRAETARARGVRRSARRALARECSAQAADKAHASEAAAPHVAGKLYARSHELFPIVTDLIAAAWEADPYLKGGTYDIAFGHEASERLSADITAKLGVGAVYFPIHRRVGNTVSASIPLAMSLAQKEARLARGARVLVIFGSAGISVGFARFTF
jgi:3-oxoacyl-[acyl-carrier-protein] synthase III